MTEGQDMREDQFSLFDLKVIVEKIEGHCTCSMRVGDAFFLKGGKLSLPEGQDFCLYAFNSVLPLLPAKQRQNRKSDWIETDSRVVCPDPACRLTMRINREAIRIIDHDDASPLKWDEVK